MKTKQQVAEEFKKDFRELLDKYKMEVEIFYEYHEGEINFTWSQEYDPITKEVICEGGTLLYYERHVIPEKLILSKY